jgi:hypothetical protein
MSPDPIDQAQDHIEKELAAAIAANATFLAAHYSRKPAPRGHCLNPDCLDEFTPGDPRLFCNDRCADAHHRLSRR